MNPSLFLPFFIFFDTVRALTAFGVMRAGVFLPPAQINFWSETFKLICALLFHRRWLKNTQSTESFWSSLLIKRPNTSTSASCTQIYDLKVVLQTAMPAALYLANNLLYLIALRFTSPALLGVAILAKLPVTAIMHYLILGRARSPRAWLSLAILCLGLLTLQLPWSSLLGFLLGGSDAGVGLEELATNASATLQFSWLGPCLGLLIAFISGFTSIVTEALMKQKIPFWTVQVWLYLYGAVFAALLMFLGADDTSEDIAQTTFFFDSPEVSRVFGQGAVAIVTGLTGIVVANILRKSDNLVKLIGGAAAVVANLIFQPLFFPELLPQSYNSLTIFAMGVITLSTWTYNFYKDEEPKQPIHLLLTPLPEKEEGQGSPSDDVEMFLKSESNLDLAAAKLAPVNWSTPTPQRLGIVFAFFCVLSLLASPTSQAATKNIISTMLDSSQ